MPSWSELLEEINSFGSQYDYLRRRYIKDLAEYTDRNVICYYSAFHQKPELGAKNAISDSDKNGFMTAIHGLDVSKGLDLVLHTPGGDIAATESIVDYLWQKFNGNIRCIVPQMAMSAGTMIACSCKVILMGRQSSLGPVDPQLAGMPAHGVLEEFEKARQEIATDHRTIPLWQPIIAKYPPVLLGECQKVIDWSNELLDEWLSRNMLKETHNQKELIEKIKIELGDHSVSKAHNRHLSADKCRDMGLDIFDLESDPDLQEKVLSVHHIYYHTLSSTDAFKIIENNDDKSFIQRAQQILAMPQIQRAQQFSPQEQVIQSSPILTPPDGE